MFYIPAPREQLLFLLPKGGHAVEIGVAAGEFSRHILNATQPERLHLIDPWCRQERADYENDPSNWSAEEGEALHDKVRAAFASEISAGQVVIHRDFSTNVAGSFPDGSLDWIYVDGLHSYEGAKADLEAFHPKLKPDGLMLGHDYAKHDAARAMGFGVVEAVDEFVGKFGYRFLALTAEAYPTFVLARNRDSQRARDLMTTILFAVPGVAEIANFPGRTWHQVIVKAANGANRSLMVF